MYVAYYRARRITAGILIKKAHKGLYKLNQVRFLPPFIICFLFLCYRNGYGSPFNFFVVEAIDRLFSFFFLSHFYKTKTTTAARFSVRNYFSRRNGAKLSK